MAWFLRWILAWSTLVVGLPSIAADATRILPGYFEDEVPLRVLIDVAPPEAAGIQTLEERFPVGWTVSEITYGGALDPAHSAIRWGPFADNLPRTLAYRLTPPIDAPFQVAFQGTVVFQSEATETLGPRVLAKRPGWVERTLPASYLPGHAVQVELAARPGASALAWALQESVPVGWSPSPVPPEASFDPVTRTLKWGPFLDPASRSFTYRLLPDSGVRETAVFSGAAIFESTTVPVTGPSLLPIQAAVLTRSLPPPYSGGAQSRVQIHAEPPPYVETYSVEEDIPAGLTPDEITEGGAWDPTQRRVKWGPFTDVTARDLSFRLTLPLHPPSSYSFSGRGVFDLLPLVTAGPSSWDTADAPVLSTLDASVAPTFDPGQPFLIDLDSRPAPGTEVHAVEVSLPPGWDFGNASHDAVLDTIHRRVKWGPFHDALRRTLHADLRPSAGSPSPAQLVAEGWFDAQRVVASGNLSIPSTPSLATRTLPPRFTPGVPFTVRIDLQPAPHINLVFIEESIPDDATVSGISEAGSFDATQSKVKWGPFPGNLRRTLSFQLTPSSVPRQNTRFSGVAVFNSSIVPVAGPAVTFLNHAPLAQPDLIQRPPVGAAKFSVIELLANDSDVDGDSLRIQAVGATSASGVRVRWAGPWIYYEAASGPPAEDQISYTIEDAYGLRSVTSATVLFSSVPITSRLAIIAVIPESGGRARVRFMAVPGITCRIEVSPDLRTWTFLAEGITGPLGTGEVIDPDASLTPVRFYRVSVR